MSQENVELVRRIYASLDRGDETFFALVSPEIVFDFSRRLIDPVVLRGLEQARAWGNASGRCGRRDVCTGNRRS